MPSHVDDFVPYKLLTHVVARLGTIDTGNGYNTTPEVTTDFDEARASEAKFLIYVEVSSIDPKDQGVGSTDGGPGTEQSLQFVIVGVAHYETEHPRMLAMALEQDVRTAVHTDVAALRASVNRGCSLRWGRCLHDAGAMGPKKQAGFRLEFTLSWSQRSSW